MPAQNGCGQEAIDARRESALHHLIHLRRWRNLFACPLFRLPTELILKIFVHAVEFDDLFWLVITAICHRLREILVSSSRLWSAIDFGSPRLAKLFLERCKFNPNLLFITDSKIPRGTDAEKATLWEELEGRTLDNLCFLMFQGSRKKFNLRVADLIRRAPNLSSLEIETYSRWGWEFALPLGDQMPHLSALRLSKVQISWSSPLLRNLTKLILDFACMRIPHDFTPIETFLAALTNCSDLESLYLTSAGPDLPEGNQEDCKLVVRLQKLKDLTLRFEDHRIVGYILSHIWFPESTEVRVEVGYDVDLSAAVSQVTPCPGTETFQHLRRTKSITINIGITSYDLTAENFCFALLPPDGDHTPLDDPDTLARFASEIVEVIGSDSVISLKVGFGLPDDVPLGMWTELLHGFPRLEKISYLGFMSTPRNFVDPFCWVFLQQFEGGPVCPRLWDLQIPSGFTRGLSAVILKLALAERSARGMRLKRISLTFWMEEYETLVLKYFEDVVDEVSRPRDPPRWFPSFVSDFREREYRRRELTFLFVL